MPKKIPDLRLETRISPADMRRLENLSLASKRSKSDLTREAVLWYLNNRETVASKQRDDELTRAIKSMTERICGMLARQGAQVGTLFELTWQSHVENQLDSRFHAAVSTVKQSMRKRLTDDERAIASSMTNVVQK